MNFETKNIPEYPKTEERQLKYVKITGKEYTWVIRQDLNPSTIWVQTPTKDGISGRPAAFDLVDDSTITLNGPWNTTADALYQDTGYDVTDRHYSFVVISLDYSQKKYEFNNYTMEDVLYKDNKWLRGKFSRPQELAQGFANKLNRPVYLYRQTQGGVSFEQIKPKKK